MLLSNVIAIPDSIDPSRMATGIVIDADGTVRHVPTKFIRQEGKSFAVIHSLTNSTYSVIENQVESLNMGKYAYI